MNKIICQKTTCDSIILDIFENAKENETIKYQIIDSKHWTEDEVVSFLVFNYFFNVEYEFIELNSIIDRKFHELKDYLKYLR